MREIDRYQRASLREQLGDLVGWFRTHRIAAAVLIVLAIGWAWQIVSPSRPAGPADLAVGDCIYARTSAYLTSGPNARPIGDPAEVEQVVMSGGAERALCASSHGHEVSAVVALPAPSPGASASPTPTTSAPPGPGGPTPAPAVPSASLRAMVQTRCDAAFEDYVGIPAASSLYETFAVVPTEEQRLSGATTGLCLVARRDGQWMISPARGSRG